MWFNMFDLARDYSVRGMSAYVEKVQEAEFAARELDYTFVSHQQEVGTKYFDDVTTTSGWRIERTALTGSTEEAQFHTARAERPRSLGPSARRQSLTEDVGGALGEPRVRELLFDPRARGPAHVAPVVFVIQQREDAVGQEGFVAEWHEVADNVRSAR